MSDARASDAYLHKSSSSRCNYVYWPDFSRGESGQWSFVKERISHASLLTPHDVRRGTYDDIDELGGRVYCIENMSVTPQGMFPISRPETGRLTPETVRFTVNLPVSGLRRDREHAL